MTFKELEKLCRGSFSMTFQNQDGEFVEVNKAMNADGKLYRAITYQNNGWIRTNVYYEDGNVDELYKKDGT